jgi:hypothetical protein
MSVEWRLAYGSLIVILSKPPLRSEEPALSEMSDRMGSEQAAR